MVLCQLVPLVLVSFPIIAGAMVISCFCEKCGRLDENRYFKYLLAIWPDTKSVGRVADG